MTPEGDKLDYIERYLEESRILDDFPEKPWRSKIRALKKQLTPSREACEVTVVASVGGLFPLIGSRFADFLESTSGMSFNKIPWEVISLATAYSTGLAYCYFRTKIKF